MDNNLRELCLEVIRQNINGEKFNSLLLETGVSLESQEWDITAKILEKADELNLYLDCTRELVQ